MRTCLAAIALVLAGCPGGEIALEEEGPRDADEDGFTEEVDCDDSDASIHPGAPERCDGLDQDCDGLVDEDAEDAPTWYADADADGWGVDHASTVACDPPADMADRHGDCDDREPTVHPGAEDACGDGLDADCNGLDPRCAPEGARSLGDSDAKLMGEATYDYAGISVAGAGDVDGDGYDDLLVGAYQFHGGGPGRVYLLRGPVFDTWVLAAADAEMVGVASGDRAGASIAPAGDQDGDGLADFWVGAPGSDHRDQDAGAVYLVLGADSLPSSLADAAAMVYGTRYSASAGRVVHAGDHDGHDPLDLLVGQSNRFYLISGPVLGVQSADSADGAVPAGESGALVGDVDGDGIGDLLVGDPGSWGPGESYLFLGPVSGEVEVDAADATLFGLQDGDQAGMAVAGAGDVDGDGTADLLIGSPGSGRGGDSAGATWLLTHQPRGWTELSDAEGLVVGVAPGDALGASVAGVGDVDGDGLDDIAVGAPGESTGGGGAGSVYLVYAPLEGTVLAGDADLWLWGESTNDAAGSSVAGAGDVDGDGFMDLLVGAPWQDSNGYYTGAAYLVYGGTR